MTGSGVVALLPGTCKYHLPMKGRPRIRGEDHV
jgi:hypothetical protein